MKKIEIVGKRRPREKHFLKENGEFIAEMYDEDIHFLKDGRYEEIDNTLILEDNYYVNKNNDYKISFTNNISPNLMKIEKDGHYIKINLEKYNEYTIEKENISKINSKIKYTNVLKNIDIYYDIVSSKIKEYIYINDKESDLEKLVFNVETDLSLRLNSDGSISANHNGEELFKFDSLYMIDSNGERNDKISYNLMKDENIYQIFMFADSKWLNSNIKYPVIIDPTITSSSNQNSVYDTFIYPGDTNVSRGSLDNLKVGVEKVNGNNRVNRTLLKFDLPVIGTGSQVINAKLFLLNYPYNTSEIFQEVINIHRITTDWNENSANWNTMNNKYDSRVDGVIPFWGSYYTDENGNYELGTSEADITALVQKWYTGTQNNGIILKLDKEIYKSNIIPKFISKNNAGGSDYKPLLVITYRNQNGLESYMNYETQSFSKGAIYHNTYNGNLTSVFDLISTKTGKMPVDLKLIYNTNDVVLNNDIGYGIGYRLNFSQTIKEVTIDNKVYLEYTDEDGTIHYFLDEIIKWNGNEFITINKENIFYDEDGLDLEIEKFDDKYILKDKNGSNMTFTKNNGVGYLTEIKDVSGNINTIEYDEEHRISFIGDADNQWITLMYSYNPSKVIQIYGPMMKDSLRLQYVSNTLMEMDYYYLDSALILIENNENKLISKITDSTKKKLSYEYYSESPYKLKKVTEYGTNDTIGNYYTVNYNFNSTTIKDSKNRIKTIIYNSNGNPSSISNLKDADSIANAYGSKVEYEENLFDDIYLNKNKLLNQNIPIRYVKNLLTNSSFESNEPVLLPNEPASSSITTEYSHTGFKSLLFSTIFEDGRVCKSIDVEKGKYYTFSAYVKTESYSSPVKLYMCYDGADERYMEECSESIKANDEFERLDATIFYPEDANGPLEIGARFENRGVCYIDDVQLEEGEVANNYNLIENSDFSEGLSSWNLYSNDDYPVNDIFKVVDIGNQKALKLDMHTSNGTTMEQCFKITGKQGDRYTLAFWYKNKGLTGATQEIGGYTKNNVFITFYPVEEYHGGDVIENYVLNPNENEWQYFIHDFTADEDFKEFKLSFDTYLNANEFYITNINLFKDVGNIVYRYDEKGNIISTKNLNDKINKFNYDKNNELIKIMNPKGANLHYEYDSKVTNRVLKGVSETGISNEIEYDSFENPKTSRIINRGQMIKAKNGCYKIRLKGTNKAIRLINNEISLIDDIHVHDKWNLEKEVIEEKDYYKIYHNIINNKYLTNSNNSLILSSYQNNNSLFELIKQDNGSFYIKNKENNKYLKNDNNNLILSDLIDNDENFEFYFEEKTNSLFIENNAEYTEDGRFITKIIDSSLNEVKYDIDTETGMLKNITNSKNQTTYFNYDTDGKLLSTKNKDREVIYEYNDSNKLSKILQGNRIYNFEYDEFLNIKNVKIGNTLLITNIYEENNGNLISTIYGNNQVINYEYDEFDRLKKLIKNNDTYNYKYNSNGDLAKILSDNDIIKYTYDLAKRLYEYKYNDFRIRYTYDSNDNIINKKFKLNEITHEINNILNEDDSIIKTKIDNDEINYIYDDLGRLISSNINNNYNINYEYVTNGKRTSMLIKSISNNNDKYSYSYDEIGNITHIYHNSILENRYYYDDYNELIREDDYIQNKTIRYTYDDLGNIIFIKEYEMNTYNQLNQKNYEYSNINWKDQLTKVNGENITYDSFGNPINIGENVTLSWINGRQLNTYIDQNNSINYKYNIDGLRTSKIINNIETKYFLEGTKIIFEQTGENKIYFNRSNTDGLIGFNYNEDKYYYIKNNQNDIIGILDSDYNIVAKYKYDSWGNIISITDENNNDVSSNINHIANINPYRYRSYYYDKENKLYYLNSRYYNPLWGRFINIDGMIGGSVIKGNLYSYCENDPVNKVDPSGNLSLKSIVKKVKKVVKKAVKKVVNTVVKTVVAATRNIVKTISNIGSVFVPTASKFLNDSLQGNPGNVCYGPNSSYAAQLKDSSILKKELNKFRGVDVSSIDPKVITFDKSEMDLYLAYHNMTLNVTPTDDKNTIHVSLVDKYDFSYLKYGEANPFVTFVNNTAYHLQNLGVIENYYFNIQFDYTLYPKMISADDE